MTQTPIDVLDNIIKEGIEKIKNSKGSNDKQLFEQVAVIHQFMNFSALYIDAQHKELERLNLRITQLEK